MKLTLKGAQKKLTALVAQKVIARDRGICQHCGKDVNGRDCHISHVVPKSAGNRLRWDILNLKVLCFHCHMNWWHKEPTASGVWFRDKFPKRMAYLDKHRKETVNWKLHDYVKLIEELNMVK